MDDQPRSLKTTFADAESKRLALANIPFSPSASSDYSLAVNAAISDYQHCLDLISAASLFSPNESLDDLATSSLPFLLINYHLAELIQKQPTTNPQSRKALLSSARTAYEQFLTLLQDYSLLSPTYLKLHESYLSSPTAFSTVSSSSDPSVRRNAKISSFQTEKSLRQKLEYLRQNPQYSSEDGGGGGGDDDLVREVHLANLEYHTHLTFNALDSLNRELEILALAPPPSSDPAASSDRPDSDSRRRQLSSDKSYTDRLDGPKTLGGLGRGGPLLSAQGKPLQPFTLTTTKNRQELAKGVFRPGHNLPTMTIDEYLEEERRRGGIIEGGGEASGVRPEPDEDDYEKADAETMKARAWDEFVEANPKGSGNTLNRG
ncbi:TAP42-like protein [Cladorrhinum samala]|uniref:TAP42-like protein n=1 Tax=Cladorrhinum samala TaxID=585594 RepID=A0AAV9HX47_9PEZI|nr:TAP42-like protein [Cladorrhinum samala]